MLRGSRPREDFELRVAGFAKALGCRHFITLHLLALLLIVSTGSLWMERLQAAVLQAATQESIISDIEQTGISVTQVEVRDELPVDSLERLSEAIVRIEALGAFVDPNDGRLADIVGGGSGFIIDESGIAVTNNHIVAGADSLQVTLADRVGPINARVLGLSECTDLAVIQLDGDGYPYVTWSDVQLDSGEGVYAGGYPLGSDVYTLVEGAVTESGADASTNWVSVNGVIEYAAPINPGYAGGPLVDSDGQVIGINYVANPGTAEFYALASDTAIPILEELWAGINVDSIGINGQVVNFVDESYGVWIAGVVPGSAADVLGLRGGDIIVSLADVALTSDQTMSTYCDILRGNSTSDVLNIQVIRFETQELLEGQLNGEPLIGRFSFAGDLDRSALSPRSQAGSEEQTTEQTESAGVDFENALSPPESSISNNSQVQDAPARYTGFTSITDDSGVISFDLPNEWKDVSNGDWVEGGESIGIYISASENLDAHFDAWYSTWDVPGVFFGFSESLNERGGPDAWLDSIDLSSACRYDGRSQLPQGYFTGSYDVWGNCGDTGSFVFVVAAMPEAADYMFVIETLSVTREDLLVVDRILDSFAINLSPLQRTNDDGSTNPTEGRIIPNPDEVEAAIQAQIDTSDLSYEYEPLSNATVSALVPAEWRDTFTDSWVLNDEVVGTSFIIATDVEEFQNGWAAPGVWTRSSAELATDVASDVVLDSLKFAESCRYDDRYDHEHAILGVTYQSRYDLWTECGETGSTLAVVAAQSEDPSQFALIEFQAVTDADAEAFGVFLNTFYITPESDSQSAESTRTNAAMDNNDGGDDPDAGSGNDADENEQSSATLDDNIADSPESDLREYTRIMDDTDSLSLLVPTAWKDISSGAWSVDGENYGLSLSASTDLVAYDEGWSTPGVFMGVSDELAALDTSTFLEFFNFGEDCTYGERFSYESVRFVGSYDVWEDCGGISGVYAVLAVKPVGEPEPLIMLNVLSTDRAQTELFEQILGNFNYLENSANSSTDNDDGTDSNDIRDAIDSADGLGVDNEADSAASDPDAVDFDDEDVDVTEDDENEQVITRVLANALNVRSNPGINNPRVDAVFVGTLLTTIGQVNNCGWLQVVTPDGIVGWVSGAPQYVTMDADCSTVAEVDPSSAQGQNSGAVADQESSPPEETPTSDAQPTVPIGNNVQSGCFLFQNELNAEVTVTITRQDVEWNTTFLMQPDEEMERCFDPGDYTYTLDAPPPWGSTNGTLEISPGDRYFFPIRSE